MNRSLASLALLLLIPLAGACSSGGHSKAAATDSAQVSIADFKFTADEVHINVGGSVTWTNDDDQQHTATSSGNFDAGAIQPGQSKTIDFSTAGTYTYVCSFHPFMHGTIVVTNQ